jgi:serine protease
MYGLTTEDERTEFAPAEGQIGRIAREDTGEIQMLVGLAPGTSPASVAADLPGDVTVLGGNRRLGYLRVRLPTVDAERSKGYRDRMADCGGVAYVEHNPVYTHDATRREVLSGIAGAVGGAATVGGGIAATQYEGDGGPTCENPLSYPTYSDDPEAYGGAFAQQYAPQQVNAPKAWDYLNGRCGGTPTVAVIDTGVAVDHPDLAGQIASGGRDVGAGDDDPTPGSGRVAGHGTHVAGIVAASHTEGAAFGVADADVLPIKIFGGNPNAFGHTVADAIQYAADNGADVANMSIGGTGAFGLTSDTVRRAVEYALDNGTLPVASAGNTPERPVQYPAAHPKVVGVSALGPEANLAEFTNRGLGVDLCGPGVDVLSTFPAKFVDGDPYVRLSGTSMAAPAVCGVAALGLAANPDLGPSALRGYLTATARDLGMDTHKQGAGLPDADALVRTVA